MDAIGILVSLLGQSLRVLVIGLVYITRGGQNRQVWANALVDTGMFAHSRNPLYLANLLLFLGLAIVHNGWAMYLIVRAVLRLRVRLHHRGRGAVSVRTLRRDVRRLLPARAEMAAVAARALRYTAQHRVRLAEGRFARNTERRSRGRAELLILLVWEHVGAAGAPPIGRGELAVIIAIWIVLAVAYLIVRTLKLSGRLGTT